jgi:RNA polymerase sigma-70 factor (ECF subfamily)
VFSEPALVDEEASGMATFASQHRLSKPSRTDHGARGEAEPTDEDLIGRFRIADDEEAFGSLMQRYERKLFGYLRRYLGNAEMAEDVCQDTFFRVHLKRHSFADGRRFRPWLYAIATHQAIDASRRARRHRMVPLDSIPRGADDGAALVDMMSGDDETASDRAEREESSRWVSSAVQELPERMRHPLFLVYHQGMKHREVADALGIPVGTVKSRLHTALQRLNRSWQDSGRQN